MNINDMVLVSVDDHVVEPPDLFKDRLPKQVCGPGTEVPDEGGRDQRLELRGQRGGQRRAQRGGRTAQGRVRH